MNAQGKVTRSAIQRKTRTARIELRRRWPQVFAGPKAPKRPLAIGIRQAILSAAPDLDRADVWLALDDYTAGPTYLRACVAGAARIGLDGEPDGVVTASEAAFAAKRAAQIEQARARQQHQQEARA